MDMGDLDLTGAKARKGKEHQYIEGCHKDHPNLDVSDFTPKTQREYEDFKAKNKVFVIGISDSTCNECCRSEPILSELQVMFQSKLYTARVRNSK
jgi:hypothetical protein